MGDTDDGINDDEDDLDDDGIADIIDNDDDGDGVDDAVDEDDDNDGIEDSLDEDDDTAGDEEGDSAESDEEADTDNDGIDDEDEGPRVYSFGFGYGATWGSIVLIFASVVCSSATGNLKRSSTRRDRWKRKRKKRLVRRKHNLRLRHKQSPYAVHSITHTLTGR